VSLVASWRLCSRLSYWVSLNRQLQLFVFFPLKFWQNQKQHFIMLH